MFMSAMVQIFSWGERWMFPSTRRSRVEWYISSFTEILVQRFKFLNTLKGKSSKKNDFSWSKAFCTSHASNSTREVLRGCFALNARTAPVAFAPHRVLHVVFLFSLVLQQSSEDCIGNTEHSNINMNDECNSK